MEWGGSICSAWGPTHTPTRRPSRGSSQKAALHPCAARLLPAAHVDGSLSPALGSEFRCRRPSRARAQDSRRAQAWGRPAAGSPTCAGLRSVLFLVLDTVF